MSSLARKIAIPNRRAARAGAALVRSSLRPCPERRPDKTLDPNGITRTSTVWFMVRQRPTDPVDPFQPMICVYSTACEETRGPRRASYLHDRTACGRGVSGDHALRRRRPRRLYDGL